MKTTGLLFFLSGTILLLGILTAEIFYPMYSISQNMISNLGATPPPDSLIKEPSAEIFDNAMIVAGIIILAGSYFMYHFSKRKFLTATIILLGSGILGVGIFPAYHKIMHPIVALLAFVGGGLAALVSAKFTKPPFSFLAVSIGIITLTFLFIGIFLPHDIVPVLGIGGTERWVAYPMILWLVGFGGYLMNTKSEPTKKKK